MANETSKLTEIPSPQARHQITTFHAYGQRNSLVDPSFRLASSGESYENESNCYPIVPLTKHRHVAPTHFDAMQPLSSASKECTRLLMLCRLCILWFVTIVIVLVVVGGYYATLTSRIRKPIHQAIARASPSDMTIPSMRLATDTNRSTALMSLVADVSLEAAGAATTTNHNQTSYTSKALAWLLEDNSIHLDLATDSDRLIQRYALAALYHNMVDDKHSTKALRDTWLRGDECNWYEVYCREGTHTVERIKLDHDKLKGSIPLDIGLLTSLTYLDLDGNDLRGRLPTTVGLLTALTRLELQNNNIAGTVPTDLRALTALTHLDLSLNVFIENIPTELSSLTNLQFLYVDRNRLTGTLPPTLESLTNLRELWLHANDFEGTIPTGYAKWIDINYAFFQNNNLVGTMPFCTANFVFEATNGDRMIADCGKITCDCCTHCCPQEFDGIPESGACGL